MTPSQRITRLPFGRTGHESSRILFGAAAVAGMRQEKADQVLDRLLEAGINHLDTAASYGESELRIGPWMREHRERFFLASKTGDRTGPEARASLERSLERLQVEQLDLIQLHNLVEDEEGEVAMAPGGAVEALAQARDEGLVRFVGVTGHGTRAAAMHLRSLERFPFDSVLFPYNFTMLAQPDYARDVAALRERCSADGVAMQTIKSVARRRWQDEEMRRFSWYEPLHDEDAIRRAVHFVLAEPDLFLNTSSDARILDTTLAAASETVSAPSEEALRDDVSRFAMTPLFEPGALDRI